MSESQDKLWVLQCKNVKCGDFFDYFGSLRSGRPISCTHCGKSSQYGVADFMRHTPTE
jgi:hypothetical protein